MLYILLLFTFALARARVKEAMFPVPEPNPTVNFGNATAVGLWQNKNQSRVFYGIRFAQPPINELRFLPPVSLELNGVIDATKQGNRCHQAPGITTLLTNTPQSEDCLNLNIFTPTNASNLPVFVYIFGGGFSGQSIQDPMYNGNRLLARTKDVVVVTFNYRQGAFGFMASEQVFKEVGSLNPGLLDQTMAFDWIKKHISAFGGDPNRITAAGQSAGALCIAAHMLANEGKQNYFHRAVLMGGNVLFQTITPSEREGQYQILAEAVGCPIDENTVGCLRAIDGETLSKKSGKANILWSLTADNYVVDNQIAALQRGQFSRIPVFLNTDKDEGTFFSLLLGALTKRKTRYLFDTLSPIFADRIDKLFSFYPRRFLVPAHWQFGEVFGDYYFQCPTYYFARMLDPYQEVYVSRFNRIINSINLLWIEQYLLGVAHASEVPHLWLNPILALPSDKRQAERFHDVVMNFVKGNPPLNSTWPTYHGGKYRFDIAHLKLESDYDRSEKCEFMVKASSDFYKYSSDI